MPCRIRRSALAGSVAALIAIVPAALLAVTFAVNSPGDGHDASPDGVCETAPGNGICTLRAAIEEANAQPVGPDPMVAIPPLSITLTLGQIGVGRAMTIAGSGPTLTIVQPNGMSRFLLVGSVPVTVRGLWAHAFRAVASDGGAIASSGALTVERCFFDFNVADINGGAIASSAALSVSDTTFSLNLGASSGGAIRSTGGLATVRRSVFSQNVAQDYGGAIYPDASVEVHDSYFVRNDANYGGAILSNPGSDVILVDSTFDGNFSYVDGGAVYLGNSPLSHTAMFAYNSTFTRNDADADLDGTGQGGAIYNVGGADNVSLANSILSDNADSIFFTTFYIRNKQECRGPVDSNGYNLVRYNDGTCQVFGAAASADPLLQPAAFNGGETPTLALAAASPAKEAGRPAVLGGCADGAGGTLATDQRGAVRPYGGECDLGAFEWGSLIFDDGFEAGDGSHWSARAP